MLALSKSRKAVVAVILLIGTTLVLYVLWISWNRYEATHNPNVAISKGVVTHSTSQPEETIPPCNDSYVTAADEPRLIKISSQQIQGCIQKVGIDQHNAIAVPDNVHLAGWYNKSAVPGENGVSLIDGHVLGRFGDAIFKNLKNVTSGDSIEVQMGDLSWRKFEIIEVLDLSVDETQKQMLQQNVGVDKQLTLITCTGTFNNDEQTYDRRIVVRAALH